MELQHPWMGEVRYVPGFEKEPFAVAELKHGTYPLLSRTKDGEVAVTGFMAGLIFLSLRAHWLLAGLVEAM
jgi:hypothetical protein